MLDELPYTSVPMACVAVVVSRSRVWTRTRPERPCTGCATSSGQASGSSSAYTSMGAGFLA